MFLNKEGGGRNHYQKVVEPDKLEMLLVLYLFMLFCSTYELDYKLDYELYKELAILFSFLRFSHEV